MTGEITLVVGLLLTTTIAIVQSIKLQKVRDQYESKSRDAERYKGDYQHSESLRGNAKNYALNLEEKLIRTESERDEYFNLLKQVDKNKIVTIHRPYKRSQTRYTLAGQYIDEKLGADWEEAE